MATVVESISESTTEAAVAAATEAANSITRALLNKASQFDAHVAMYHAGHVTGDDIETEDTIRNTNRTES